MTVANQQRTELAVDTLFEVLADDWCRSVLYYLDEAGDGIAPFGEVVDHLIAIKSDAVEGPESGDYRERVAIALHYTCLPKLAGAEIVDDDQQRETIRYHGGPRVDEWLDRAAAIEHGEE